LAEAASRTGTRRGSDDEDRPSDHLAGLDGSDRIGSARSDSEGSMLLDRGIQQGWISATDIDRRPKEFPKRYGNGRLRRLRELLGDGAAAKSERLLKELLRSAGISDWRPNVRVPLGGGESVEIDAAFPVLKIGIEIDGWAYHSDVERFRGDRRKQNALVARGWIILRFTWSDLTERPEYVLAAVRRVLASRIAS
jgi:very-short-patch-repair endonuclease